MEQNLKPKSVVPLESNPEVFTSFARNLGLSNEWSFMDIYSMTDDDLLSFIPRPIKAVILLFPLNAEIDHLSTSIPAETASGESPIWFKQTIRNACGLYALLHSLSNNSEILKDNSILKRFLDSTPTENGKYVDNLEVDDFLVSISEIYNDSSMKGDTLAPPAEDEVELHFITFIEHEGKVFELDGRNPHGARVLGESSDHDLLNDPLVKSRFEWYQNLSLIHI